MSILGNQTTIEPGSSFYAPIAYVASGDMGTALAFSTLPIINVATDPILILNDNLMPEVGKSYFIQVSLAVNNISGSFTTGAFMNIGLQYDGNVVSVSSVPNPGASVGLVNVADIFTRVASPGVPLQIIVGNNMGGSITAGDVRLTAINVIEVPSPKVLVQADIVAP